MSLERLSTIIKCPSRIIGEGENRDATREKKEMADGADNGRGDRVVIELVCNLSKVLN